MLRDYHYVYRVTHIPTGKHYIGSRTSRQNRHPHEDLGKHYWTSSTEVRQLFKARPRDFLIKIIRVYHLNPQQARQFEQRLIVRCNAIVDDRFFNKAVVLQEKLYKNDGTITSLDKARPAKPQYGSIRTLGGFGMRQARSRGIGRA